MVEAGGHGLLTFRRQDLIVVSPGVPLETPEIAQAIQFGTPVIGELSSSQAAFSRATSRLSPARTARPPRLHSSASSLKTPACPRSSAATSACPSSNSLPKANQAPGACSRSPAFNSKPPSSSSRKSRSCSTSRPIISTATRPSSATPRPRRRSPRDRMQPTSSC